MCFICCDLRVLARKLQFGHLMRVYTQVQLAFTCDYLPVYSARALELRLRLGCENEFDLHENQPEGRSLFHMKGSHIESF